MKHFCLPLLLMLIPLTGCQSQSTYHSIETIITPAENAKLGTYLAEFKVREMQGESSQVVMEPKMFVLKGKEGCFKIDTLDDDNKKSIECFECRVLIEDEKSTTSVSINKKGRLVWSSTQSIHQPQHSKVSRRKETIHD